MNRQTVNLDKFSKAFREHAQFATLVTEIERSPTLVNEINNFPGEIRLGDPGSGMFYLRKNWELGADDAIVIDADKLAETTQKPQLVGRLVTGIAHELGHAQRPGGFPRANLAATPDEATQRGLKGEGVAITAEYIVAKELNRPMWSDDPTGRLKEGMDALAATHGLNTPAFNQAAETLGTNTTSRKATSVAPSLRYNEYYAYNWVAAKGASDVYNQIDWRQMQGKDSGHPSITYSTDPATHITTMEGRLPLKSSANTVSFHASVDSVGQVTQLPVAPATNIDPLPPKAQALLDNAEEKVRELYVREKLDYDTQHGHRFTLAAAALAADNNMSSIDMIGVDKRQAPSTLVIGQEGRIIPFVAAVPTAEAGQVTQEQVFQSLKDFALRQESQQAPQQVMQQEQKQTQVQAPVMR